MEVMSSLLLCALVALLPQGLGRQSQNKMFKFNNSLILKPNNQPGFKLLLHQEAPMVPLKYTNSKEGSLDMLCKKCAACMERALEANQIARRHFSNLTYPNELFNDVPDNTVSHIVKRDVRVSIGAEPDYKRKSRSKKNNVTVTKYRLDGEVYAVKVKEVNTFSSKTTGEKTTVPTCLLYSVKKSFPCDSTDAETIINLSRKKPSKKGRRNKHKFEMISSTTPLLTLTEAQSTPTTKRETTTITTTTTAVPLPTTLTKDSTEKTAFRKREVDNSQMPENVMSSLEDFY